MQLLVSVRQTEGQFEASVLGTPLLSATGETKELALAALNALLGNELESGMLSEMEVLSPTKSAPVPSGNIMEGAGLFVGDDSWPEILEEIYRQRDLEKHKELPG